jgi:hypothetical protein
MQSLVILGRQPALGLAELESLFGSGAVSPWGNNAALLGLASDKVTFSRLGGSIKAARVLKTLDTTDIRKIETSLLKLIPEVAAKLEGKVQLGISTYGLQTNIQQLLATGLKLKKELRKAGHSVRLVPNSELALGSASVAHNHLTGIHGLELLLVRGGPHDSQTIIAQTTAVQDIDSYTLRDRGRPKRDARVGMLPPKLAQIIINLAVAQNSPLYGGIVLDPFCGTGVVLQEATVMGYDVYGTDIDPRMIEFSDTNLMWLLEQSFCPVKRPDTYNDDPDWRYFTLEQGDATNHLWKFPPGAVACETYLGKPFTSPPSAEVLAQTVSECNLIIKKFLRNIASQIPVGIRLCLAVPAWQVRAETFKYLPSFDPTRGAIDSLADMGYNLISFEHVRPEDLIYYRADQIVARQLLVLTRN